MAGTTDNSTKVVDDVMNSENLDIVPMDKSERDKAEMALGIEATQNNPLASVGTDEAPGLVCDNTIQGVYCYSRKKTFRTNQKDIAPIYENAPSKAVTEIGFTAFKPWYSSLPFSTALESNLQEGNAFWRFRILFLYPEAAKQEANSDDLSKYEWATNVISDFYLSLFNRTQEDKECIEHALKTDASIVILASKIPIKKNIPFKAPRSFFGMKFKFHVVGAITFKLGIASPENLAPILVTWLAVNDTAHDAPAFFGHSYRRQGFGTCLLIHAIKRSCQLSPTPVDFQVPWPVHVFLQCTVSLAYHFYLSCGFVHLNHQQENDGFDLLPPSLKTLLTESPKSWIRFVPPLSKDTEVLPPCKLMWLRPGTLRHSFSNTVVDEPLAPETNSSTEKEVTPSRVLQFFTWCEYPPPLKGVNQLMRPTTSDIASTWKGMHYLNNLLPDKGFPLLPPSSLKSKGFLSSERRQTHADSHGKTWIISSELELMITLLMRDGRYDENATILSTFYVNYIELAFEDHLMLTEMTKMAIDWKSRKPAPDSSHKIDPNPHADPFFIQLVAEKFNGKSPYEITRSYNFHLNWVLENVIAPNPGLLSKHCLIFPQNVGDHHWIATFVFNADKMNCSRDSDEYLQPCFYQYCPFGNEEDLKSDGIIWFLNCAVSYRQHHVTTAESTSGATASVMKWLSPYGNADMILKGTKEFPRLQLNDKLLLPKQIDGYNCGIGIVAAMAVLLRDFFDNASNSVTFEDAFSPNSMPVNVSSSGDEHVCPFPETLLSRNLPREQDPLNSYLGVL